MTVAEIEAEKKRARELALAIGGVLVALLALRPASQPVLWDAATGRFIIDGRFVSAVTIREQLLKIKVGAGNRMAAATDKLSDGTLTLEAWKDQMRQLVGSSHVLMAALGVGSIAAAASTKLVQDRIESERKYVDRFADDIPKKKLSTPTIKARARSYMLAAGVTYAGVTLAVKKIAGFTEARRITTAAESCEGCIDYANRWMDINKIPPIGTLQCQHRCCCYLEYR